MSLIRSPNIYYGVGRRRRMGRRRVGGSFLSVIGDALGKAHNFIKGNKLVSRIASGLSAVGVPYAGSISSAASALGYGRRRVRRRVRRRRVGGSLRSILSNAHNFVKSNRLISKGLRTFLPNSNLHKAAHTLGYGRRRTVRRRRAGGSLRSILSNAHNFVKSNRLISKGLRTFLPNSNLHKAAHTLGYGRRRVRRRRAGGSLRSILSNAHNFVKSNRLISKGLRTFLPNSNLHKAAHTLGYGRRRTVRRRVVRRRAPIRRHRGGANFFSTEQIAVPRF